MENTKLIRIATFLDDGSFTCINFHSRKSKSGAVKIIFPQQEIIIGCLGKYFFTAGNNAMIIALITLVLQYIVGFLF
jgi:hypothetical protein